MKKIIFIFIGVSFILTNCTFDECTSKTLYMVSFKNFIEKIENNYKEYDSKEWDKADEKFEKLTEDCYNKFKDKFTEKDKKKIVKYGIKYSFYRIKSNFLLDTDIKDDDIDNFLENIDEIVDKKEDVSKILEKIKNDKNFKSAAKDFEKGIKNLGKGIDKLGKELEKIFEDINK